ncbi:transposase [Xenorhabdus bovienii str. Jollieti]|uniref:Transposase n=1 Tax=Xenorhabdus bovienii (strain SS-2004) TaxID=406818 RepID=D3V4P8_XENBS|nr:transposase [Xenorhabdus bovienii SS-2004]CDH28425.1 transposase [Xenorhabdus bovienii str. Jollieti]
MALVEVKCRFYDQSTTKEKLGINDIIASPVVEPSSSNTLTGLAMNNAGIRDTARALHVSINAVVRTLKNSCHDVYSAATENGNAGCGTRGSLA